MLACGGNGGAAVTDTPPLLEITDLVKHYAVRGGALYLLWPSARHVPVRVALLRDHLIVELQRLHKSGRV